HYGYSWPRFLRSLPTRRSSDLSGHGPSFGDAARSASPGARTPLAAGAAASADGAEQRRQGAVQLALPVRPAVGAAGVEVGVDGRSEEHTSELQSRFDLVCRLLL